jgi:hypothetical protein
VEAARVAMAQVARLRWAGCCSARCRRKPQPQGLLPQD